MRGAGDHWSIGERVAFYRVRRGLTQAQLAGLVERGEDWLSKIERGERTIQRLDLLVRLADVLRVSLGDLLGQPVLVESDDPGDNVPAIRQALMTRDRLSTVLFGLDDHPAPSLRHLSVMTERTWTDYQQGRLARTLDLLPELLTSAHALERHDELGRSRWGISSRIHHLASTTLSKIGEADLAWIAAERAMTAADSADDPLVLASAARSGTHALLAVGRYTDAIELGTRAHQWLHHRITNHHDPAALSLAGALNLRMAIAAARRQDRSATTTLLRRADAAAEQLGHDDNQWQTAFGPTNVRVHRVSAALDLGDVPYVTTHGDAVDTSPLPTERQVCHLIDLARAHSYHGHDEHAAGLLLESGRTAPDLVRHNPAVRETTRTIWRRNPATLARRPEFLEFAVQCRATP